MALRPGSNVVPSLPLSTLPRAARHPDHPSVQTFGRHKPRSTGQEGFEHTPITSTEKARSEGQCGIPQGHVFRRCDFIGHVTSESAPVNRRHASTSSASCRRRSGAQREQRRRRHWGPDLTGSEQIIHWPTEPLTGATTEGPFSEESCHYPADLGTRCAFGNRRGNSY